ncbi:MAG: NAD(P)H-dependent oxidoreductase subunit E [Gemmatimonadetes bacterium]|nr:NAD(P)H-dependent oxidoreductase subunit E [Gemmatimonadota bacterium]
MGLIAELYRLQEAHGYLRDEDLQELSERRRIPLHRIGEVVSFYPHFRRTPPPRPEVLLCRDLPCVLAGGDAWRAQVMRLVRGAEAGATTGAAREAARGAAQGAAQVECREVSCLGRCDAAPAALVDGAPVTGCDPEGLAHLARHPEELPEDEPTSRPRRWRIDVYDDADERYAVYRDWSRRPSGHEEAISILKAAGLRGMGGAGFPTGRKWELVRREAATPKYVVCNADESEPGTFKDRVILEELPHLVVEGMCLAAHVVGAERGWIYIRHEYGRERKAVERALEDARTRGVLGDGFDIEVFVSPGGYILGEETALLEALEDRRGEPRNKPPYPGTSGLRSCPTLINNVETLGMVPPILRNGAEWWRAQGVRGHAGLKFMAVCGHVERPGVYEIPMGTTVAELIRQAGGVRGGRGLKAFAPGGASSSFLPAEKADVELDFDSVQAAGSMLGSGALVVVAEGTDMMEVATNVVRFFRNESCGKCVPCRVGTEKVVSMLEEILAGHGDDALLDALPALSETLARTSICGLGQVALNPLTSVLEHWRSELDAHLARVGSRG